jgi:multiple RNA-binding domain-containing protein 1
VTADNLIEQS